MWQYHHYSRNNQARSPVAQWTHVHVSLSYTADGLNEFIGRAVFRHKAGSPSAHRIAHRLTPHSVRQDKYMNIGHLLDDLPDRLNTATSRRCRIHQDYIRSQIADQIRRNPLILCQADDLNVSVLGQPERKSFFETGVVIDDKQSDTHGCTLFPISDHEAAAICW